MSLRALLLRPIPQHVFTAIAVLALVLAVPADYLFLFTLAVGQAHFIGAFIYQVRAKKMTASAAYLYVLAAVALSAVFFAIDDFYLLTLISAAFFTVHHASDEIKLLGYPFRRLNIIMSLFPAGIYMIIIYDILNPQLLPKNAAIVAALLLLCLGLFLFVKRQELEISSALLIGYFFGAGVLFCALLAFEAPLTILYFVNIQALFHYVIWYFYQYGRLRARSREVAVSYIKEMCMILAGTLAVLSVYLFLQPFLFPPAVTAYNVMYAAASLYAFTIVHVISSAIVNVRGGAGQKLAAPAP